MLSRRTPSHPFARKVRSVHQGQLAQNKPESWIWEAPNLSRKPFGIRRYNGDFPLPIKAQTVHGFLWTRPESVPDRKYFLEKGGVCGNGFAWHEWPPRRSVKVRLPP